MQVSEVRLADISHDWGTSRGWVRRRRGETMSEHALRLGREVAAVDKFIPYASAMRRGEKFPPVYIVRRGRDMLLVDGCHRVAGAAINGRKTISARVDAAASDEEASELADAFWEAEFGLCPRLMSADGSSAP